MSALAMFSDADIRHATATADRRRTSNRAQRAARAEWEASLDSRQVHERALFESAMRNDRLPPLPDCFREKS